MVGNSADQAISEEKQILKLAVEAFRTSAGSPAEILPTAKRTWKGADAAIRLEDGQRLLVEVKWSVSPATLGAALAQITAFGKPGILITRYVTPQLAERLKAQNVFFLDTAGNAYIRTPHLFIYVIGRKLPVLAVRERAVRALRPTGLKVIFALLCRPELINASYRDVADLAGVALGTVNSVFFDLRRLGYLDETKARGRIVNDRRGLVNKWAGAYAQELRPRLKPQRYRVADADWWKRGDLAKLDMWLGGEPAAGILTKHLRPEIVTIYGDTHFTALARRIKPVKDEYGNLEVLQKFWTFDVLQAGKTYPLVPPLLIYADLLLTGDARNIESAQLIRERFLDNG